MFPALPPPKRPTLSRSARLGALAGVLALTAAAMGASGCAQYDKLFNPSSGGGQTLELQSISVKTDHPVTPSDPTGPAVASSGQIVQFTATGTFLILGSATLTTNDVTNAVLWVSTAPDIALPGSDGRVLAGASGGIATITATSPAVGSIPALTSNAITLSIQ
jgi:hypothetical protein